MEPMAYAVKDVCRLLGISRTTFYRLVQDEIIKTRKLGTRTLVLARDLEELLENLPSG